MELLQRTSFLTIPNGEMPGIHIVKYNLLLILLRIVFNKIILLNNLGKDSS